MSTVIIVDYDDLTYRQQASKAIHDAPRCLRNYICSLFPVFEWIHRYNLSWLLQDIIAGVTVGIVMVPQGMAYAKLANLDPQYGLYSSFAGAAIYCLFGTSKDISIGPISTVSLLVGQAVTTVVNTDPSISPAQIGVTLALFVGICAIGIGCIRLGILVDFIPGPAIAGFMTGSAITITLSQLPSLAGTSNSIDTHQSPYLVFYEFFAHLGETKVDLAFGLIALITLYAIKWICERALQHSKVSGQRGLLRKAIFYFSIMRSGLIVIVATLISFIINASLKQKENNNNYNNSPFSIIGDVPAGFDALGVPMIDMTVIWTVAGIIPSIVLILILEHVSVAKSFGRVYNYTIRPDQEIFAIGVCNVAVAFFGGYPSTGAFSRTAIMARSGSKTPLAGLCSATVVVLALYVLTPAFYYIPDAALAAVVIHAVSDLVSGYSYLKELWTASWFELGVWLCAVLITFFVDVEVGIYVAIGLSVFGLLVRLARPPVQVLGRLQPGQYVCERDPVFISRLENLPRGLVVLRPIDSILYPNAAHVSEVILDAVKMRTKGCSDDNDDADDDDNRGNSSRHQEDLLWNQEPICAGDGRLQLPPLQALIFDFSAVRRVDATGLQMLVNLRKTLDNYAGQSVEWHFVNLNVDVRRNLLAFGFGTLPPVANKRETTIPAKMSSLRSYDSIIVTNNGFPPPQDKYPCFHYTIDAAVRSVCVRRGFDQA